MSMTGKQSVLKKVKLHQPKNLKEIAYPAQSLEILSDRSTQYSAANLTFTLPKYYGKISVYNKSGTFDAATCFQISKIIIVQNHLLKAYTKIFLAGLN